MFCSIYSSVLPLCDVAVCMRVCVCVHSDQGTPARSVLVLNQQFFL